jgi:hypothetical protein
MLKRFKRVAEWIVFAGVAGGLVGCVNPPKRSSAVRPGATKTPNDSGGGVPEFPPPSGPRTGSEDTSGQGDRPSAPVAGAGGVVVEYWLNPTKSNNCLTIQVTGESPINAPCTGSVTPDQQWVSREYRSGTGAAFAAQVTIDTTDLNGAKFVVSSDNPGSSGWRLRCASAPTNVSGVYESVLCYEDGDEATLRAGGDAPRFDSSDLFVRVKGPQLSNFGQVQCSKGAAINMNSCSAN